MFRSTLIRTTLLRLVILTPLVALSYWLAWALRYDFALPEPQMLWFWRTLPAVLAIKIVAVVALQGWHEWMRYVSFRDLVVLAYTLGLATAGLFFCEWFVLSRFGDGHGIPLTVVLLDFLLSLVLFGGVCSLWRFRREHLRPLINLFLYRNDFQPALLVGANRTGVVLANQIQFHPSLRYNVVGFLDEDRHLYGTRFGGLLVHGGIKEAGEVARRNDVKEVFVLDGSLSGERLRDLVESCQRGGACVRIISNIYDLVPGANRHSRVSMRNVDIDDLLRRDPVVLDDAALTELLGDEVVMVTGAGGSIGSEICRQVLRFKPRVLALVERAENSLFHIERELRALGCSATIVPFIADVTEERRMRQVFETCQPKVLFHAAAHKHVPMMESNPSEALANNVFGTQLLADLASEFSLKTFVLISTDKAVRPTSVMGLSKQIAERYLNWLSKSSRTRYVVVRFGNVLGSAGSVVPIFQEQIERGGPITITHPDMERYFMTIPEASQLVLQAGAMGCGGEIFVLDMGAPVKIVDLARDLIRLSNRTEAGIEIQFTGVRPGEKLYEELYFDDEQTLPTPHAKLRVAYFRPSSVAEVEGLLGNLKELVYESDPTRVHQRLRELFPEFPYTSKAPESSAHNHNGRESNDDLLLQNVVTPRNH